MTNQYMNTLYHDLLSNSPQTVTIDIPADMGTGQILQIVTKQGAVVSDWRMNYFSDVNVQGVNSEEYIQLLFCLNDYFESSEMDAYGRKLLTGISKISITPYMEHIFAELKDFAKYCGGLGYLFLESKIFELLSVYLSEVLELRILASNYLSISKSDRDAIVEAKRMIDSQLAFAPGCEELARKVNISTSKLTKGFSSMFGMSVHAYVIDQRLEKAAGLLLESNLNVSQVAALVGYSKPSNFAAAFKKKYGVIPKNYKAENMIG